MAATPKMKAATVAGVQYTKNTYLDASEVRTAATNQWRHIHSSLGLKMPTGGRHGPCPVCGGKDRFRLQHDYEITGRWVCGGGGDFQSGDGISFVMHCLDSSYPESIKAVADLLGLSDMDAGERLKLKQAAKKARDKLAAEAMQRTQQAHQDSYVMDCLFDYENAVKARQGEKSLEHSSYELFRAARLQGALEQNYGGLRA